MTCEYHEDKVYPHNNVIHDEYNWRFEIMCLEIKFNQDPDFPRYPWEIAVYGTAQIPGVSSANIVIQPPHIKFAILARKKCRSVDATTEFRMMQAYIHINICVNVASCKYMDEAHT